MEFFYITSLHAILIYFYEQNPDLIPFPFPCVYFAIYLLYFPIITAFFFFSIYFQGLDRLLDEILMQD